MTMLAATFDDCTYWFPSSTPFVRREERRKEKRYLPTERGSYGWLRIWTTLLTLHCQNNAPNVLLDCSVLECIGGASYRERALLKPRGYLGVSD
jgi:hypothetical protein